MQILAIGQVWAYVGESHHKHGTEYEITELPSAVKVPNWGWHKAVRYRPLVSVAGAPNDYIRTEDDFRGNFQHVR